MVICGLSISKIEHTDYSDWTQQSALCPRKTSVEAKPAEKILMLQHVCFVFHWLYK